MKNDIIKAIQVYVDNSIKNASFDRTRTGIIVNRNPNNTYTIKMDGLEYNNVKSSSTDVFEVGDIVKISIPNNQPSQMYIDKTKNGLSNTLIYINSTNGTIFYNEQISTTLQPQIKYNGKIIDNQSDMEATYGVGSALKWYTEQGSEISVINPFQLTIGLASTVTRARYIVKLVLPNQTITSEQDIILGRVDSGKSAYQAAIDGGLPSTTTEEEFNADLAETPNKADQTGVNEAIDALSQTVDANSDSVVNLTLSLEETNEQISTKVGSDYVDNKVAQNSLIGMGYAIVDPTIPSVKLGKSDSPSYTEITNSGVFISTNNVVGASIERGDDGITSLNADNATISTLRMKNVNGVGRLTWIAQETGHLTLKEI